MRKREEFYCHGCDKYFLVYLRDNMFGNYTIECPECSHSHHRKIEAGVPTEDRHNDKYGKADIIVGLKTTVRDTPWHNSPEYRKSQIRAVAPFLGGNQNA